MTDNLSEMSEIWQPGRTIFTEDGVRTVELKAGKNIIGRLKEEWKQFAAGISVYPGGFEGRGIVICAGGLRYLTCAWVGIELLRKKGCTLPIEIWYVGNELTPEVLEAFTEMGVRCRNALDYASAPAGGYALKPFAILHSSFREVLYLDADNVATVDPAYLFDSREYKETGTIFWPDIWVTARDNPIWEIVASQDYVSTEQESGQVIINKERCWKELNLCMYFNEQRVYYYAMLLGDKDTFKFAWIALGSPFFMIERPVAYCGYTNPLDDVFFGLSMVQHDPAGNIIFLHRNLMKWDITAPGEYIWEEIRRFKQDAETRIISCKRIDTDNGLAFDVLDIQGDIERSDFRELFGSLEKDCLQILNEFRNSPVYGRYLLYTYFSHFKPSYLHNPYTYASENSVTH
jgi:alpha 1,2-mannosyltransferase